jgi:hypothetical protein
VDGAGASEEASIEGRPVRNSHRKA